MFLCYLKGVHRKPETENSVSNASFLIHNRNVPEMLIATKYWCYKEKSAAINLSSNQPWPMTMSVPDCMLLGASQWQA